MKVIALDQSTSITAYSVWNKGKLKDYGVIKSDPKEKNPVGRMRQMYEMIKDKIESEKPDWIAIEGVQYQTNQRIYSMLSQLQGVLFALFFYLDIGFTVVEVKSWKSLAKVQGRKRNEQKNAAIQLIKEKYNADVSEDEAESILIGEWVIQNME